MKTKQILLASMIMVGLLSAARADTLENDNIQISGVIREQSSASKTGTLVETLTIPNILAILGVTVSHVGDLRYYYDETTDAYVIAPKGILNLGFGTPVATLFANGTFDVSWIGVGSYPVTTDGSENATGLNGNLQGSQQSTLTPAKRTQTVRIQAILSGTVGGNGAVMQISILDVI